MYLATIIKLKHPPPINTSQDSYTNLGGGENIPSPSTHPTSTNNPSTPKEIATLIGERENITIPKQSYSQQLKQQK